MWVLGPSPGPCRAPGAPRRWVWDRARCQLGFWSISLTDLPGTWGGLICEVGPASLVTWGVTRLTWDMSLHHQDPQRQAQKRCSLVARRWANRTLWISLQGTLSEKAQVGNILSFVSHTTLQLCHWSAGRDETYTNECVCGGEFIFNIGCGWIWPQLLTSM